MSTNRTTTWSTAKQGCKPQPEPCCEHDCTSGTRNRYFLNKHITPDVWQVEQDYQIGRRRLVNRAVHGWGVVYGYPVTMAAGAACGGATDQAPAGIKVGAGLAFDRMGRELVQTDQITVSLDDMLELPGSEGEDDSYLLRVHYAEQLLAPVSVKDSCSCERQQWDRVCETVRYSLQRVPRSACCDPHPCELDCSCAACCTGHETRAGGREDDDNGVRAGAARCLCDHLTELSPGAECSGLTEVSKRVRVDLHNGVALACLSLQQDECGKWHIAEVIDACGPRRLVKRNDLLFDLIRGCDLTRISEISWAEWHRSRERIAWDEFDSFFDTQRSEQGGCETDFVVRFTRPVRIDTLTADCFSMTFLIRQREGGWLIPMRAPIVRVIYGEISGDEEELAQRASLVVGWGWVCDALRGLETEFERPGVTVEMEIYGDFILDCNGQALDADARGRSPGPSGNGTPGGTFRSSFQLDAKPLRPDPDAAQPQNTVQGGNLS
ncbi:hypothetical protein [Duganella sp. HH101]|uniref:hypothetical protein n=1 Tax=Duganella sp. HH101 TaxID=1781066 RepID=UPI0008753874|nr:hypothetical protein [Duganella sp. HH101]OFA06905.1 hypothetical protein DUGA2_02370 [Duganella sp. HH101]